MKDIIELRRKIHQIPELANNEYNTQKVIIDFINNLNCKKIQLTLFKTAIIAYYKSDTSDVIAYRSELDGLPIVEENDLSYKSLNNNMHACGHDFHIAIALGILKLVVTNNLPQSFLFIFQHAEESGGGALEIINNNLLINYQIKSMYAIHVDPNLTTQELVVKSDALFAYAQEINVCIQGKKAHGARPHEGVDALIISSLFLTNLQTILTRFIDEKIRKVVTFGKITGGDACNIICDKVILEGTIRTFDLPTLNTIKEKIQLLAKGLEYSYDCVMEINYNTLYPSVKNDHNLANHFTSYLKNFTNYKIINNITYMYGEDFGSYTSIYPCLMVLVGASSKYPLHHQKFNPNEEIVIKTINLFYEYFVSKSLAI